MLDTSPDAVTQTEAQIARNVAQVRERIAAAAHRSGRTSEAVTLIAVTKTVAPESVLAAVAAGVTVFGENYVQEARVKIPTINATIPRERPLVWHLIGHLQSNKAKYCIDLFDMIQTVDGIGLAQEIGRQASKRGRIQPIVIEVNLAEEPQRAGVLPDETSALVEQILSTPGVSLNGLMGIAPFTDDPEGARSHFRRLRRLWDRLPSENRQMLSMGMSGDFEVAVEEGATHVRIGTALFGSRAVSTR